jgi:hypothetical protein
MRAIAADADKLARGATIALAMKSGMVGWVGSVRLRPGRRLQVERRRMTVSPFESEEIVSYQHN